MFRKNSFPFRGFFGLAMLVGSIFTLSAEDLVSTGSGQPNKCFVHSNGCGKLKIGGIVKQDFIYAGRSLFLNKNVEGDNYQFVKFTMDLNLDFFSALEEKESGIILHSTIRHKSIWGNATESFRTLDSDVLSPSGAIIGSHSHDVTKPGLWVKDLYVKTRVDKILKKDIGVNNCCDFTAGFFPFVLGRGISLGGGYGTPKDFLGIYSRVNDFSAPGVLFHAELFDGGAYFDAYYSKLDSKSASAKQTLASKREKIIGSRLSPWAGSGNDDNVYALQAGYKFSGFNDNVLGDLSGKAFSYAMYNAAPGKNAELEFDSQSDLLTFGLGFEGKIGKLEFGFEGAKNFGQEMLYNIDRNKKSEVTNSDGIKQDIYSHIDTESTLGSGNFDTSALVTKALSSSLNDNLHQANSEVFVVGGKNYKTKSNRIRPAFNNKYRGWMCVFDGAYLLETKHGSLKPSFACGIASGDGDPMAQEVDKNYNGFIGLNELYAGKRVRSIIILDDRNIRRPMTIGVSDTVDQPNKRSDGTFTDIRFIGYGLGIKPSVGAKFCERSNLNIDLNALGFWKDHASKAIKIDSNDTPTLSDLDARRFMGTELNLIIEFEPVDNLKVSLVGAIFFPGGYYKDIAGARIKGDAMKVFEQADLQKISSKAYSIGSDTSYYFSTGFTYKF